MIALAPFAVTELVLALVEELASGAPSKVALWAMLQRSQLSSSDREALEAAWARLHDASPSADVVSFVSAVVQAGPARAYADEVTDVLASVLRLVEAARACRLDAMGERAVSAMLRELRAYLAAHPEIVEARRVVGELAREAGKLCAEHGASDDSAESTSRLAEWVALGAVLVFVLGLVWARRAA